MIMRVIDPHPYTLTGPQQRLLILIRDSEDSDVYKFEVNGAHETNTLKTLQHRGLVMRLPPDYRWILTELGVHAAALAQWSYDRLNTRIAHAKSYTNAAD